MPDRRGFLRLTVTLAAASASQFLLQACAAAPNASAPTVGSTAGSAAASNTSAPASAPTPTPAAQRPAAATPVAGVKLPTYVPIASVKPDLPGTETVPDGYLKFPRNTFKSVSDTPGTGSDITWMTYTIVPNAALGDNAAWQEVNRQVGANLVMQL